MSELYRGAWRAVPKGPERWWDSAMNEFEDRIEQRVARVIGVRVGLEGALEVRGSRTESARAFSGTERSGTAYSHQIVFFFLCHVLHYTTMTALHCSLKTRLRATSKSGTFISWFVSLLIISFPLVPHSSLPDHRPAHRRMPQLTKQWRVYKSTSMYPTSGTVSPLMHRCSCPNLECLKRACRKVVLQNEHISTSRAVLTTSSSATALFQRYKPLSLR